MGKRTLVWVLVALLAAPSLAGCLSDLERQHLDVDWSPQIAVHQGPVAVVDGLPAMVSLEGVVAIEPEATVEVTGLSAHIDQPNRSIEMTLARLTIGERSLRAGDLADVAPTMSSGTPVRASLLPAADQATGLHRGEPANLTFELRWRYREGDRFDAGRLMAEGNQTVLAAEGLGVGAGQTDDDAVDSVVWPAIEQPVTPTQQAVDVFAVEGDGTSRLGPAELTFRQGEGVALADLDQPVAFPDGHGYLIFMLQDGELTGAAVHTFGEPEQATPGPAAWLTLGILVSLALLVRRRRSGGARVR